MTKKKGPTPLQRLKGLIKRVPDEENEIALFKTLKTENADYPIAIIAAAMIERALQYAILQRFIPAETPESESDTINRLFSYQQNGPLADFGTRIFMARLLGIFGPVTHSDLNLIHRIRNTFAHSPSPCRFTDPEVSEALSLLSRQAREPKPKPRDGSKPNLRAGSDLYIVACIEIVTLLRERKPPTPEFPMWDDVLP
jgi:DNA-binding MltR family transcriptional regulator